MTAILAARPLTFAGSHIEPGDPVVGAAGEVPDGRMLGVLLRRGFVRLDDGELQRHVDGDFRPLRNEGTADEPLPEPTSSNNEPAASVRPTARRQRRDGD